MGEPRYLSSKEAADYLGLSGPDHVRRLRRQGLLEGHISRTGRLRFTQDQLDRFVRGETKTEAL